MPDIVGALSPNSVRLFVHRLHEFFCLFFSIKETHWGIFFKLYPVSLSTDFVWILITEDPVHTLSSGSFKLFLKTHDQASINFFLILHWVTLDKDIGICLNQKNSLCPPHQGLCAKHFLILHCIKLKINGTEETQTESSPRHALFLHFHINLGSLSHLFCLPVLTYSTHLMEGHKCMFESSISSSLLRYGLVGLNLNSIGKVFSWLQQHLCLTWSRVRVHLGFSVLMRRESCSLIPGGRSNLISSESPASSNNFPCQLKFNILEFQRCRWVKSEV